VREAVICAACGAKVREDRLRCLRCGEALVARQKSASKGGRNNWVTIGIVAGCLALGGFSILLVGGAPRKGVNGAPEPLQASRTAVQSARPAGAAPVVAGAVAPDPAAASVSDMLAGQKAYESGNLDAALQRFQAAVDANPNDVRSLSDLGQVLVRLGRTKDAIQYFDRAVQLSPASWTYQFNRARAYAQLQQWGQAVQGYRTAGQLFPDDYATQYNLAKALQSSGDLTGAIAGYEKAIQLAPGQSDFQLSYGLALESANRPKDAAAAYRRYLELEPQSPEAEKVKAHLAKFQPVAVTPARVGS